MNTPIRYLNIRIYKGNTRTYFFLVGVSGMIRSYWKSECLSVFNKRAMKWQNGN